MFVLQGFTLDYTSRLLSHNLLSIMYWLGLQDVLYLVKCLKYPSDNLNIFEHISITGSETRSFIVHKLQYKNCWTLYDCHFYFNQVVRLWNALSAINLPQPITTIKHHQYKQQLWNHLIDHFHPDTTCSFDLPWSSCYYVWIMIQLHVYTLVLGVILTRTLKAVFITHYSSISLVVVKVITIHVQYNSLFITLWSNINHTQANVTIP